LLVGAGKDVLLLDEIQPAGKKRMSGADFVRGYPVKVGEVLG
jgi:methionyl-tRNA formyltransferase